MNTDTPDGYKNATDMAHPTNGTTPDDGCGRFDEEAFARTAIATEQEAKRIEKIQSHASSHHCSGTVSLSVELPRQELSGAETPSAAPANTGDACT